MNFLRIVIAAVGFMLVACASQPKPPKAQEFFTTQIKRDGIKQFSYTLVMDMPKSGKRGGGGKRGGPGGPGGGHGGHPDGPPPGGQDRPRGDKNPGEDKAVDDRFNFIFDESLIAKLSDTGFCQQGYKQLDRKSRVGAIQITGECNDMASNDDKIKFPNPQPVKVKEQVIE